VPTVRRRKAVRHLQDGQTYFHFSDWLGTRRGQTNAAGDLQHTVTCTSYPFGDGLTCAGSGVDATEHHFTGKERDSESGLDYFGARYNASSMGRFMSPDWAASAEAVPYANFEFPQTLNLYSYAGNNPLTRTDPDGHFWQELGNCFKWGHCVKDSQLEGALQKEADQYRQTISAMRNLSINGRSPADAIHGMNNKQVVTLDRSIVNFLSQQVLSKPSTMMALAIVGAGAEGLEAATSAAIAEGRATAWIVQTGRSALANDVRTNLTAAEFGGNLEASGYVKSVAKDGATTVYSKGNEVYSVYKGTSFGGTSANLNVAGRIVTKIRLQEE
jgi:RHS repeat-associated protein